MKKTAITLLALLITYTSNTGCSTGSSPTNPVTALPDVANFLIQNASSFVAGASSLISVAASGLANGTYTVNFSLSDANSYTGPATLTINGGTGTFQTPVLANSGETKITINSISNSGGASPVTNNNTWSISDSTGLMTAIYAKSGASTNFRATEVTANTGPTLTGTSVHIHAVMWEPALTTIDITDYLYNGVTGATNFNSNDLVNPSPTSVFNGSAAYGVASSSLTISDLSAHGKITITATSPLLTGTFSYTNTDSSTVSGTFSCPAP